MAWNFFVRVARSGESWATRSGCHFRAAFLYAVLICSFVAVGESSRTASMRVLVLGARCEEWATYSSRAVAVTCSLSTCVATAFRQDSTADQGLVEAARPLSTRGRLFENDGDYQDRR